MTNVTVNTGTVNINGGIFGVRVGELELLASGSILTHDNSPIDTSRYVIK
ncbi:MAG: hypothetical protein K0R14_1130 [Burkholderiales bacterium]|jgi:hypothetical protein|nr:hypothetical protein [Burkholderiales bacterium]